MLTRQTIQDHIEQDSTKTTQAQKWDTKVCPLRKFYIIFLVDCYEIYNTDVQKNHDLKDCITNILSMSSCGGAFLQNVKKIRKCIMTKKN